MNKELRARDVWARGGLATAVATIVNVALAALLALMVSASPQFLALQPGPVASATVVTMLAGTALFAILNRTAKRPMRVFTVLAVGVAALSLIAPISLAMDTSGIFAGTTTPAAAFALVPLHLVPALALLAALAWRPRQPSAGGISSTDGQ